MTSRTVRKMIFAQLGVRWKALKTEKKRYEAAAFDTDKILPQVSLGGKNSTLLQISSHLLIVRIPRGKRMGIFCRIFPYGMAYSPLQPVLQGRLRSDPKAQTEDDTQNHWFREKRREKARGNQGAVSYALRAVPAVKN